MGDHLILHMYHDPSKIHGLLTEKCDAGGHLPLHMYHELLKNDSHLKSANLVSSASYVS